MTTQEIVRRVVDALEQLSVPYMLVGSFSSNAYGVPRNTQDVDFVVQLEPTTISQLAAKLHPAFQLNPQTSFETITATTRYLLDVPAEDFAVELFLMSDDPHDRARFERAATAAIARRPGLSSISRRRCNHQASLVSPRQPPKGFKRCPRRHRRLRTSAGLGIHRAMVRCTRNSKTFGRPASLHSPTLTLTI